MSDINEQFSHYLALLRNGDSDAVFSLIGLGPGALPLVASTLQAESDPVIREQLVHVAWQTRAPATVEILASAIHDTDPRVWKEAIDGLVAIGTPQAVVTLRQAKVHQPHRATCGRYSFQQWIDDALSQIRDPS